MSKTPKVAVLLAGCGHLDGAEVREAVLTLLALDQQGDDAVGSSQLLERPDFLAYPFGSRSVG